jgi:hypothetical protein
MRARWNQNNLLWRFVRRKSFEKEFAVAKHENVL